MSFPSGKIVIVGNIRPFDESKRDLRIARSKRRKEKIKELKTLNTDLIKNSSAIDEKNKELKNDNNKLRNMVQNLAVKPSGESVKRKVEILTKEIQKKSSAIQEKNDELIKENQKMKNMINSLGEQPESTQELINLRSKNMNDNKRWIKIAGDEFIKGRRKGEKVEDLIKENQKMKKMINSLGEAPKTKTKKGVGKRLKRIIAYPKIEKKRKEDWFNQQLGRYITVSGEEQRKRKLPQGMMTGGGTRLKSILKGVQDMKEKEKKEFDKNFPDISMIKKRK